MEKNTIKNNFAEHLFEYRSIEKKKLVLSLSITLVVMIVEFVGGYLTHSMALISDAWHMFTHSFALTISIIGIIIARKPPCHHKTFGLYRAEILAAFINGIFLLIVVGIIIYKALQRIMNPEEVFGFQMLMIAILGLGVNIVSIIILHGSHKHNLNVKSVFYHMLGDAVSSVGVVIAAVVIIYTGWNVIDPIVSIGISAIILYWAYTVLKESTIILLEMAPVGMNIDTINNELKTNFPEIKELSCVHLWTITPDMLVFSAHIILDMDKLTIKQEKLISNVNNFLSEKYKIIESTIQIVSDEKVEVCNSP